MKRQLQLELSPRSLRLVARGPLVLALRAVLNCLRHGLPTARVFLVSCILILSVQRGWSACAGFFADFNDGQVPAGTSLFGNAYIGSDGAGNNALHLTDPFNGNYGIILIPGSLAGSNVTQLTAHWRSLIGGGSGADGYSFNWANDFPNPPDYGNPGEEGAGTGLSFTINTFDNGGGGDTPGIGIKWQSNRVAFVAVPPNNDGSGHYLRKNQLVDADVSVTAGGLVTFT